MIAPIAFPCSGSGVLCAPWRGCGSSFWFRCLCTLAMQNSIVSMIEVIFEISLLCFFLRKKKKEKRWRWTLRKTKGQERKERMRWCVVCLSVCPSMDRFSFYFLFFARFSLVFRSFFARFSLVSRSFFSLKDVLSCSSCIPIVEFVRMKDFDITWKNVNAEFFGRCRVGIGCLVCTPIE